MLLFIYKSSECPLRKTVADRIWTNAKSSNRSEQSLWVTYQHRGNFTPVQSLAESGESAKTCIPVACVQRKKWFLVKKKKVLQALK